MKSQYVRELAEGVRVDALFAVRSKEMRTTKSGEAYLSLELGDRTGRMPAVWFRPSGEGLAAPAGTVVRVGGVVTSFRGIKRVSIERMRPEPTYDPSDLLTASTRSRDELVGAFNDHVKAVSSPELRRVLRSVFGEATFFERFSTCPGSQQYHHAFVGGLIEHTVAVASLCRSMGGMYPGLDGDVLLTAALLHDIGKVDELIFDTTIRFSDEGRLLGHVVLGITRLRESVSRSRARVREDLLLRVEHAMLSHHGELEWGSPKRPSTVEALVLHHVDNLDAKAAGFSAALSAATCADELWTDANNLFRRPLFAPMAAEDDREGRAEEESDTYRRSA